MKQLDLNFSETCHCIALWIVLLLPTCLNGADGLNHANCAMLVTQVERLVGF